MFLLCLDYSSIHRRQNMNQNTYCTEPENSLTTENCHFCKKNTEINHSLYCFFLLLLQLQHLVTLPHNKHEVSIICQQS